MKNISMLKLMGSVHLPVSEVWNEPYGLHGSGTFVLSGRIPGNEGDEWMFADDVPVLFVDYFFWGRK